jgi:hypothetical protein
MSVSPHDEATAPSGTKSHRLTYIVIGAVVAVLLVVGIVAYGNEKDTREAREKAARLEQAWERAGLPAFADTDTIVRTLGSDGGAVCDAPNDALTKAQLKAQLSNGAAGPAMRPIQVDRQVVVGEALVLAVYCPEKLPDFRELVDSFDFDNTIRR